MIDRNKHFPVRHFGGHWAIGHWPRLEAVVRYIRNLILLNSPASIVRAWLVEQLLGSMPSAGTAWPIFVSHLPDGDGLGNAVCVYDSGMNGHGELPDGQAVQHYRIQLRIRSEQSAVGRTKLGQLLNALSSLRDEKLTLGIHRYEIVNAVQRGSTYGGVDEQRRNTFLGNCSLNIYRLVAI